MWKSTRVRNDNSLCCERSAMRILLNLYNFL